MYADMPTLGIPNGARLIQAAKGSGGFTSSSFAISSPKKVTKAHINQGDG
jgi:hypothetical protein